MELQFNEVTYPCLWAAMSQVRNEELTQELRLTDGMPDIGKVLGCWALPLVRGKEWRRGGMSVSGGCQVWVLYAPEDGTESRSLETWIPFQLKWDFSDTEHDGVMQVQCLTRFADARTISARKLMLRVGVSALGDAWVPGKTSVYTPGEMPQDVQLLTGTYPMRLPAEAGEKPFSIEDQLNAPGDLDQIVYYSLRPELIDQKEMAGKAVFRGMLLGHVLYRDGTGAFKIWDFEVPFSQYAELERDYAQAEPMVVLCLTGAELEQDQEGWQVKAGVTAQYVIYDRQVVSLVEDAYSPCREIALQTTTTTLPALLDERRQVVRAEGSAEGASQILDAVFYAEQPIKGSVGDDIALSLSGQFQALIRDAEGKLMGQNVPWESEMRFPAAEDTGIWACLMPTGKVSMDGDMKADGAVQTIITSGKVLPMVTGLELGEQRQLDPSRPSLILQRAGDDSLWQLAKACGSTVDAICRANDLTGEPEGERMLLIPVL